MFFPCPVCGYPFEGPKVESHTIGCIPFKVTVFVDDANLSVSCTTCGTKFTAIFRGDPKALQEGYTVVDYRHICRTPHLTSLIAGLLSKESS